MLTTRLGRKESGRMRRGAESCYYEVPSSVELSVSCKATFCLGWAGEANAIRNASQRKAGAGMLHGYGEAVISETFNKIYNMPPSVHLPVAKAVMLLYLIESVAAYRYKRQVREKVLILLELVYQTTSTITLNADPVLSPHPPWSALPLSDCIDRDVCGSASCMC